MCVPHTPSSFKKKQNVTDVGSTDTSMTLHYVDVKFGALTSGSGTLEADRATDGAEGEVRVSGAGRTTHGKNEDEDSWDELLPGHMIDGDGDDSAEEDGAVEACQKRKRRRSTPLSSGGRSSSFPRR